MPTPDTMMAVVKTAPGPGAELRRVPVPDVGPSGVLIRVRTAAVCGTDLHIYNWDHWAEGRVQPPLVFGHEFCGVVEKIGPEVSLVRPGDLVSAEMHVACGRCYQCRTGASHICRRVKIIGVDADGCFAEFVRVPESNVWKVDPAITPDIAAVFDPLGNAVHAVLAGPVAAAGIAVIGCGPIGQFAVAVARACGASRIFAIEINERRLAVACRMGADVLINPAREDPVARVLEETAGSGADVVLEMSGHPQGVKNAFAMLRMGGQVTLLGIPIKPVEMDLAGDIIFRGATVAGINGRRVFQTWYQMEALLKGGRLDITPAITDRLPLAEFHKAMDLLRRGEGSKILLEP
jgi:threonine 3-dehydrogenase